MINTMRQRIPGLVILPAHDPGAVSRLAQASGQGIPSKAPSARGLQFVARPGSLLVGGLGTVGTGIPLPRPGSAITGKHCAGEKSEDFADGRFLAGGLRQWHVGLDLVTVAAAVLVLHHIASFGEVGDDAVGAPLGDA